MPNSTLLTMRQFYHILGGMYTAAMTELKSKEEIQKLSKKRLTDIVKYAKTRSPFYAELYKDIDTNNFELQDLPSINKRMLMDNFDHVVTEPRLRLKDVEGFISNEKEVEEFYMNKYKIFKTSGSSGEGAILVCSLPEIWKSAAYEIVRGVSRNIIKELPRILLRGFIRKPLGIAVIAVIGPHHGTASALYSLMPSFFMPTKGFDVNSSDEEITNGLNEFDPFVILAYPTKLEMLAHQQLEGKLSVKPKYIKTVAEVLTSSARHVIEEGFGVRVKDTYGCSEAYIMAGECELGKGLHMHEDVCIVEPVDQLGNAVNDGELCDKVYVTNLLKYTQPVIRYELEDVLSVNSNPCPCGSPMSRIEAIYGRNFDMLWVKKGNGCFTHIHPQGVDASITLVKGVKNYQVIQDRYNKLNINIMLKEDANEDITIKDVMRNLKKTLFETGVDNFIKLEVQRVNDIRRDPVSRKIRRIISRVESPDIAPYLAKS